MGKSLKDEPLEIAAKKPTVRERGVRVEKERPSGGLTSLRRVRARTPEHVCENCRCKRYSPCGCMKKAVKQ